MQKVEPGSAKKIPALAQFFHPPPAVTPPTKCLYRRSAFETTTMGIARCVKRQGSFTVMNRTVATFENAVCGFPKDSNRGVSTVPKGHDSRSIGRSVTAALMPPVRLSIWGSLHEAVSLEDCYHDRTLKGSVPCIYYELPRTLRVSRFWVWIAILHKQESVYMIMCLYGIKISQHGKQSNIVQKTII